MSELRNFRILSFVEGLSLLALVLVAMPLKYAFDLPLAVRVAGSVHGLLFLALVLVASQALFEQTVSKGRVAQVLGLSVLPFGFVFADRILRAHRG